MIHFTSDIHFGHANIIRHANRPFADVAEMDAVIIANWNLRVQPADDVYILGDVSFHKPARTVEILDQLKGRKHLIRGNHDAHFNRVVLDAFTSVHYLHEIKVAEQKIVMCHYAMRVWNGSHRGTWQLYGHSHGTLPDDPNLLSLDVGMDCWDFRPITFDDIAAKMAQKIWAPVDHHGADR